MGHYDAMQVCENGHVITDSINASGTAAPFCAVCGAKGIAGCQFCQHPIRGRYISEVVFSVGRISKPPAYCANCGKPYPWTSTRIAAATELIAELGLAESDQQSLTSSIMDLVKDSSRTEVAIVRYQRIVAKMAASAKDALKSVLIEVVSEGLYGP